MHTSRTTQRYKWVSNVKMHGLMHNVNAIDDEFPFCFSSADDPVANPGPEDILDLTKATDNFTLEYIDHIHHKPQVNIFSLPWST